MLQDGVRVTLKEHLIDRHVQTGDDLGGRAETRVVRQGGRGGGATVRGGLEYAKISCPNASTINTNFSI